MLVLTGLGVLGVSTTLFVGGDAPEPPVPQASAPVSAAPSEPPLASPFKARPPVVRVPDRLVAPEVPPGDEGEHGEFTTSTDLVKQKIFKTEPKLAQFSYYREHVLLDSNSRKDYEALLADRAMYEQTRHALLYPMEARDSMESNIQRLIRIDYLREALAWRANPERGHLLSEVESLILEDSFGSTMPPDVKRSVAATKMELFELFHDQEPGRARAMVEAARGTRLERLLEYIAARNQRRLAKEKELSLQAQRIRMP